MVEKVIPQSLNYADLKPEAIENEIKLIKFTPTATVTSARQNDVVKFIMQGNGFLDPYSTYIKMTIRCGVDEGLVQDEIRFLDGSAHSIINRLVIRSQGVELERIEQYDVLAKMINDMTYSAEQKVLHHAEGFPTQIEQHRWRNTTANSGERALGRLSNLIAPASQNTRHIVGEPAFFRARAAEAGALPNVSAGVGSPYGVVTVGHRQLSNCTFNGRQSYILTTANGAATVATTASATYTFVIPLYSGILGVLMPDKKLLPLSLMPLDVEFTLNPHALYSNNINGSRNYTVTKFAIYSHMMFFEQEVHRSLEAVVAENGIFIHFNSFYLAPITAIEGVGLPGYAQINVHFKSINSVHFCFLYGSYNSNPAMRKLSFASHCLSKLQVRNGTFLIPSEPLEGNSGSSWEYEHVQFLLETYKAWNKMHDPMTDSAINAHNYTIDDIIPIPDVNGYTLHWGFAGNAAELPVTDVEESRLADEIHMLQSTLVGCSQYGISLEGEELGSDQTIITGRKAMLPFDINLSGTKSLPAQSFMHTFVRADFVIYIRPDLVVQLLGR